jgi:hypothetical protein
MTIGLESSSTLPPTAAKADLNVLDLEGGRDWRSTTGNVPVVEAAGRVIRIVIPIGGLPDGAPLLVALALALTPELPGDLRLAKRPANAERLAAADEAPAEVAPAAAIGGCPGDRLLLPMADDDARAEPPPLAPAPLASDTNISRTPTMPFPG